MYGSVTVAVRRQVPSPPIRADVADATVAAYLPAAVRSLPTALDAALFICRRERRRPFLDSCASPWRPQSPFYYLDARLALLIGYVVQTMLTIGLMPLGIVASACSAGEAAARRSTPASDGRAKEIRKSRVFDDRATK
jgi:hypothetical protein